MLKYPSPGYVTESKHHLKYKTAESVNASTRLNEINTFFI